MEEVVPPRVHLFVELLEPLLASHRLQCQLDQHHAGRVDIEAGRGKPAEYNPKKSDLIRTDKCNRRVYNNHNNNTHIKFKQ